MGNSTIKIDLLLIFTNVTVLVKQKLFAMTETWIVIGFLVGFRIFHFVQLHIITFLVPIFGFPSICFVSIHVLFMCCWFFYNLFPYTGVQHNKISISSNVRVTFQ